MKIENEKIGFSFDLPERLTVRQQLKIMGLAAKGEPDYFGIFKAALPMLENWQCEILPDPAQLDIDKETNPKLTSLIYAVAMSIFVHANRAEEVDPNS